MKDYRYRAGLTAALLCAGMLWNEAQAQEGRLIYLPSLNGSTFSAIDTSNDSFFANNVTVAGALFSAVAVSPDQSLAYLVDRSTSSVLVVNTATNSVVSTIGGLGLDPNDIEISPDGTRLYVTNLNSNTVSVIDTGANLVVATIPTTGTRPVDVAVSSDGAFAYVSHNFNPATVTQIDTATNTVVGTFASPDNTNGIYVSPDGSRLYASQLSGGSIYVFDTATGIVVDTIATGSQGSVLAGSADGTRLYAAGFFSDTVSVVDLTTNTVIATIPVGDGPQGLVLSVDGTRLYVANRDDNTVQVFDADTYVLIDTLASSNSPRYISACSNGNALLASGNVFTANSSGALECTRVTATGTAPGPIFTGGTMLINGPSIDSSLPIRLDAAGGSVDASGTNTARFSGLIDGPGKLTKEGTGTLILGGTNTYSGGTDITEGTLQIDNVAALGTGLVSLQGGALLGNVTGTLANNIRFEAGTSSTIAATSGETLTLSGAMTLLGTEARFGQAGIDGTVVLAVGGVPSLSATLDVFIDGGTVRADDPSSRDIFQYSDSTTIGSGAVLEFNDANFPQLQINTLYGSGTARTGASAASGVTVEKGDFSGGLEGAGGLTVRCVVSCAGGGTLILRGTGLNTYSGPTTVGYIGILPAYTLQGGAPYAFSAASAMTVNEYGTLDLGGFDQEIGSLAGSGSVTNSGAAAATLVTGGDDTSTTFSGVISDGAEPLTLVKTGAGTMTLTNNGNSYTGGTEVNEGTLLLAAPLAGSGQARISGGVLDLGGNTQTQNGGLVLTGGELAGGTLSSTGLFDLQEGIVSAKLDGTGNVVKSGPGTVAITNAVSTSGSVDVQNGILEVAAGAQLVPAVSVNGGSFISNGQSAGVTVNSGKLGGTGTVGITQLNSGATLAPGNSIGTITVSDSLSFAAGSRYEVEVSTIGADRTDVVAGLVGTGTADLSGGTVVPIYEPGSYIAKRYIILSAAGGLGGTQFAALADSAPAGFTQALAYSDGTVELVLDLEMRPEPQPSPEPSADPYANLNRNQSSVRDAIVGHFDAHGGIQSEFGALSPEGLTQASGETGAAAIAAGQMVGGQFLAAISTPQFGDTEPEPAPAPLAYAPGDTAGDRVQRAFGADFGTVAAPVAPVSYWNSWGAAYGAGSRSQGDTAIGSSDVTAQDWGLVAGHDIAFGGASFGAAFGGGWGSYELENGFGSGTVGSFNAGLRATQELGAAYLSGALAYGYHAFSTSRSVTGERYEADFSAHSLSGRAEAGWRFETPAANLTPYGAVETIALFTPAYRERGTGTGLFALSYQAEDTVSTRLELGARLSHAIDLNPGTLTLSGRAAWQHNLNPSRDVTAGFVSLAGTSFVTDAAAASRNSLLLTLGADYAMSQSVSLGLTADAAIGDNGSAFAGKASLKVRW